MCGIIGFIGQHARAKRVISQGLKWLEYRGYDSAGIAIVDSDKKIEITKCTGSVDSLISTLTETESTIGIGHTRWATHGNVSDVNAHPFVIDDIAVVHNGIIENHDELRTEIDTKLDGQTDSEVVARLIAKEFRSNNDLVQAVAITVKKIKGTYAIAVVSSKKESIVLAKKSSPIVVGVGDNELVFASDIPAILNVTPNVFYLVDYDIAELRINGFSVFDSCGNVVKRPIKRVDWSIDDSIDKTFEHQTLKEIYEQPDAIEKTLQVHLEQKLTKNKCVLDKSIFEGVKRIIMLGMGTSHHAAMLGKYWFESIAKIETTSEISAEFRYRNPVIKSSDLVVLISQSGETADTLNAAELAKESGAKLLTITNVVDSALARISDHVFYTNAGFELGVASTKAFTTQLVSLLFLAAHASAIDSSTTYRALRDVSTTIRSLLVNQHNINEAVQALKDAPRALFLGRGVGYPIAMEGALKLKEISYIHAEAYSSSEMKHGPIALIGDPQMPVVVLISSEQQDKSINNVYEIKSRGAKVVGVLVTDKPTDDTPNDLFDVKVAITNVPTEIQPIVSVVVLQLIAYNVAKSLGRDIDKPRNLAKVVTVE